MVRISYAPNLASLRFCGVVGMRSPLAFDIPQPPCLSRVSLGLGLRDDRANVNYGLFYDLFAHFPPQVKRIRLDMERKVSKSHIILNYVTSTLF